MHNLNQKGFGLSEVVVSLMLLAVGGMAMLEIQNKSADSTMKSATIAVASNLAADLEGRMMRNYDNLEHYQEAMSKPSKINQGANYSCYTTYCSGSEFAYFDAYQVAQMAAHNGINIYMSACPGGSNNRKCLYMFLDGTTASSAAEAQTKCTSSSNTGGTGASSYKYSTKNCLAIEVL